MITLITGTPGAGKTAWLISQLLKLQVTQPHRRLLAHGIPAFKLSHIQIFCRSPFCDICQKVADKPADSLYMEDWPTWKQPYDLIVADEVQRVWKAKSGGIAPPDIALLDTHRHSGLDFWLITQSTKLLHSDVRVMISRHIHLVAKWSGRKEYEWPECHDNVSSTVDAVERPYTLPKHVYKFYKSAEVHTKQDKRRPVSFYATIAAVVVSVLMIGFVYHRINKRISPQNEVVATGEGGVATRGAAPPAPAANNEAAINKGVYPDFKPTVEGVPESAPAYSELLKVTAVPLLVGCVYSKATDVCSCYTAQATPYPASKDYCMAQIKNKRFNPYFQPQPVQTVQKQPDEQSSQASSKKDDKTEPS